jgi:hypothetical protein
MDRTTVAEFLEDCTTFLMMASTIPNDRELFEILEKLEETASHVREYLTSRGVECVPPPLPYTLWSDEESQKEEQK